MHAPLMLSNSCTIYGNINTSENLYNKDDIFFIVVAPSRKVTPNYVQEDYARVVNQIEQFLEEEYILDFVKGVFMHVATTTLATQY